jgi:tRNA(Ile)-lysidine synthase
MALLTFLMRNHAVTPVFFNHGTEESKKAEAFLTKFCDKEQLSLIIGTIGDPTPPKGISKEEHWRNERYSFFSTLNDLIVTAHNLNDCVETWIWGCLHGTPQLIPYSRGNVFRPLLTTEKKDLIAWCVRKEIPWVDDESNNDTSYMRNFIRHEIIPRAYKVNPGLNKVIKKKLEERRSAELSN